MRRLVLAVLLTSSPLAAAQTTGPATVQPTTAPATAPTTTQAAAIPWDQAAKHVGETITVTGPVLGIHEPTDGSHVVLNVGKDYPDPTRFTVFLTVGDNPPDAQSTYVGKTITVTGKVEMYHNVPEIRAHATDLTIQK